VATAAVVVAVVVVVVVVVADMATEWCRRWQ
jgi:hypothetical protein